MDTRGSFAVILAKCSWEKICHKFSLKNISPYSAVYKSNILISGKILNEVKYENFHDVVTQKATMAGAVTKIPHASCEVPFITS
jgi:hypothetical protein